MWQSLMSHVISDPSGCCSLGTQPRLFVISSAPSLLIFYLFCLFFPSVSSPLALLHHSGRSGLCSMLIVVPIRLPRAPLTQAFFFPCMALLQYTSHSLFIYYLLFVFLTERSNRRSKAVSWSPLQHHYQV